MKKSKIISPFNLTILFVFLITVIYVLFYVISPPKSKYSKEESQISGIVYDCQNKENKTVLKIKGKENILINYYDHFNCKLGIKIKAQGEIKTPKHNTNFYLFDYQNYLKSNKINYTFTASNIDIISEETSFPYKIKNYLNKKLI